MAPNDSELLDGWRNGDRDAGEMLVERYYVEIDRFFANKVSTEGPDLVQETFKRLVEARDRIREGESFRSYLFSIAYRVFNTHLRSRYRERDRSTAFEDMSTNELDAGPRSLIIDHEEQRLLLGALRRIEHERQCLLELYY